MHQPTTPNHQNPHYLRQEACGWACRDAVRTRCEWDEAYSGRAKALRVYEKRKPAGATLLDGMSPFFISLLPPLLASSQSGRQLSRLDFFGTFCIKTKSTERKEQYYPEDERIASRIGMGGLSQIDSSWASTAAFTAKHTANYAEMGRVEDTLRANGLGNVTRLNILRTLKTGAATAEPLAYYYHGDHLGSAAWVTDSGGAAIQHIYYLPFGETFLNQKFTTFSSRYSFSAKEKDEETGYSYFGARYYNSDLSVWLSVDPMADKYPSLSPYAYCRNNPIMLVDPNGMWDHEAKAIRFRNRAARKYGEDRVSDVFNRTIGDGKANYSL